MTATIRDEDWNDAGSASGAAARRTKMFIVDAAV